jgi:predicted TIM-barrel fold metal-dependent hydrolase
MAAHRIDVHFHPTPPGSMQSRGDISAAPRKGWTMEKTLIDMEKGGVAKSMMSLPHPVSTWQKGIEAGRKTAREWNDHLAQIARDHPGLFGVFATLPITDVDGCLREIEYAFDTLHADGINMMTNMGDKWLGDPHYWPIFEELNRRKAVVYTHPMAPLCCASCLPELSDATIEFGTDTTRAIAKLLFSGAVAKFPDIRFIFSHAGGTMPFIVERFEHAYRYSPNDLKALVPKGVLYELKRMYYDTAQAAHRHAMSSLRELVPATQILFGTDYPYRTPEETAQGLSGCGFSAAELRQIDCDNALRLLPARN